MTDANRYWFPAKRYGWGWGLPKTWQGWAVFAFFLFLLAAGFLFVPPARNPVGFALWTLADGLLLTLVCWLKGEPPRWRWGGK